MVVEALGRVVYCRNSVQTSAAPDTPTEYLKMVSAVSSNGDADRPEDCST